MKKILSFFALAALLLTASCSKQESPVLGEDQVIISLGLEGVSATRAISDGSLVDKLVYEVYDKTGALLGTMDKTETVTFPYSLSLPLAKGQDYTILFWAQDSDCQAYNTDNLKNVTVNYTNATNNDETRDAFYAAVNVHVTGGPQKVDVVLNRPFAQVNVAVPQAEWQRAIDAGVNVSQSSVVFTQEVAKKIDLLTGNVSEYASVQYTAEAIPTEKLTVNNEDYVYLSMSYILVGKEKSMVNNATFTFNSNVNAVTLSVPNLPVQRNYRTNVLGTFLVDYVDFNIVVDPIYNTPDEVYPDTDIENLYYAAANGGEVTLSADVKMPHTLIVADDKEMVLNLNGHDIIVDNDSDELGVGDAIVVYGKLTIKGEGTVQGNTRAVWARGYYGAEVRIEGGNYIGSVIPACEVIYASGDGKIEIYGGTFEAKEIDDKSFADSQYAVLNLHGNGVTGCNIIVYGGSFKNFNPADNISENPKHNFCAPEYGVYKNYKNGEEWYDVMYTAGVATIDAVVKNAAELGDAIANGKKNIVLAAGNEEGDGEYGTILAQEGITYIGSEGAKVDCINLNGEDNVTIKNIAFDAKTAKMSYDGKGNAKQYANIISGDSSKKGKGSRNIVIESCEFNGTFTSGGAAIAFTDQNRGSGQSGNISIVNCSFNAEGAYYHIYGHYFGYAELNIEGNKFTSATQGTPIYLGRYQSSTPIVLKNNVFEKVSTLEDAIYVQDHSNYGVSVNASGNTFAK